MSLEVWSCVHEALISFTEKIKWQRNTILLKENKSLNNNHNDHSVGNTLSYFLPAARKIEIWAKVKYAFQEATGDIGRSACRGCKTAHGWSCDSSRSCSSWPTDNSVHSLGFPIFNLVPIWSRFLMRRLPLGWVFAVVMRLVRMEITGHSKSHYEYHVSRLGTSCFHGS